MNKQAQRRAHKHLEDDIIRLQLMVQIEFEPSSKVAITYAMLGPEFNIDSSYSCRFTIYIPHSISLYTFNITTNYGLFFDDSLEEIEKAIGMAKLKLFMPVTS